METLPQALLLFFVMSVNYHGRKMFSNRQNISLISSFISLTFKSEKRILKEKQGNLFQRFIRMIWSSVFVFAIWMSLLFDIAMIYLNYFDYQLFKLTLVLQASYGCFSAYLIYMYHFKQRLHTKLRRLLMAFLFPHFTVLQFVILIGYCNLANPVDFKSLTYFVFQTCTHLILTYILFMAPLEMSIFEIHNTINVPYMQLCVLICSVCLFLYPTFYDYITHWMGPDYYQ
jgi:hypothetical protein